MLTTHPTPHTATLSIIPKDNTTHGKHTTRKHAASDGKQTVPEYQLVTHRLRLSASP